MTRTSSIVPVERGLDFTRLKRQQQGTSALDDYAQVGVTLQIVGERLAEGLALRAGERIVDVGAVNGNFSLAAARRYADVTSTDYVPPLLEQGRRRA